MPLDVHRRVQPSNARSDEHTGVASIVFGVIISVPGLIFRADGDGCVQPHEIWPFGQSFCGRKNGQSFCGTLSF